MLEQGSFNETLVTQHLEIKTKEKYYLHFAGLYIVTLILTAATYHRFVVVRGIIEPGGNLIFPLMYFLGDLIAEVYGYKKAKNLLFVALTCDGFFSFAAYIIVNLPTPMANNFNEYNLVFNPLPKMFLISAIGMTLSAWINVYLVSKWRNLLKGQYFILRSIGSSAIGEAFLSVVSIPLIFLGQMNLINGLKFALAIYLFKLTYTFFISFPGWVLMLLVKRLETL